MPYRHASEIPKHHPVAPGIPHTFSAVSVTDTFPSPYLPIGLLAKYKVKEKSPIWRNFENVRHRKSYCPCLIGRNHDRRCL